MKVLKTMYYVFVAQNVLSFRIQGDKIIPSTFVAFLNVLKTNVIPLFNIYIMFSTKLNRDLIEPDIFASMSTFMQLLVTLLQVSQPFLVALLSFINFKKRNSVYQLAIICIRVHKTQCISFRAPIKKCFSIFIFLIFITLLQTGVYYVNYYVRTWMNLFMLLLTVLVYYFPLYVILPGIFYFQFVIHLLDHTIESSKQFQNIDSIANHLILTNDLIKKFSFAYGPQVSFTVMWIIFMIIVNVSCYH